VAELKRYDPLIQQLAADLTPVRRLWSPTVRALCWLGGVAIAAAILAAIYGAAIMLHRLAAVPDMWLAVAGSTLTAVLAAVAAFQLSLPGAKPTWVLLPLPGALLWISASGAGCLRSWLVPDTHEASLGEVKECLFFIVGMSVPLSLLLIAMLRRAYSLRPNLTAAVGGLAVAAAAATLLNFCHPYDATATDLLVHLVAVALVVLANRAFGGRVLAHEKLRAAV
jgi:hypothetical protein